MNPALRDIILGDSASVPSFAPTNLAGLLIWLDAADTTTITLDGSNNVSRWNDKSGNGRNVSQGTALNRPTYLTNQLNGLGAIKGNGTNQWLDVASFPSLAAGYTIYAVSRSSGNTSGVVAAINPGVAGGAMVIGNDATAGSYVSQWGASVSQPAPTLGTDFARMVKYDGSHPTGNYRIRLNTQAADTTGTMTQNANTPPVATLNILRSTTTYSGQNLYELMIFNRQTTAGEDTSLKAYITAKWGLTWA